MPSPCDNAGMAKTVMLLALFVAYSAVAVAQNKHDYKTNGGELLLPSAIVFEADTDKLKPESNAALDFVRDYLVDKTDVSTLRIESHTAIGNSKAEDEHNQWLSRNRARAILNALIARGIECQRLVAVGFGGSKPAFANDTVENRAKNARVVIVNAALRGRPIGGGSIDGGGQVAEVPCVR